MPVEKEFLSSEDRPNLEEFLSALNGFLGKETSPTDPSYVKFLGIFLRSVGANTGHFLMVNEEKKLLHSVISYGMEKNFEPEFNAVHGFHAADPSPLTVAFEQQDVVAISDLNKERHVPSWFVALMEKFKFNSLVAVPLMGTEKPVGVLCAYYHDVCLFDQGTLAHLSLIGRMVGTVVENSLKNETGISPNEMVKEVDEFLLNLTTKPFSQLQVFTYLAKVIPRSIDLSGLVCGPIRKAPEGLGLNIAAGHHIPKTVVSKRVPLPRFLEKRLLKEGGKGELASVKKEEWGKLDFLIESAQSTPYCSPLKWQNKIQGAVIVWRNGTKAFSKEEDQALNRFTQIASLALNVK